MVGKKRILVYFSVVVSIWLVILSGCNKNDANTQKPAHPKQVASVSMQNEPVNLNVTAPLDESAANMLSSVYEGLVKFKGSSLEIEPCLAQSYSLADNKMDYTFELRKDVKFHDGTAFNADAVIANFNRFKDATDANGFISTKFSKLIAKVVKVDSFKVVITLKEPYTPFLSALAMNYASPIISPALIKNSTLLNTKPVGTGPYKFVKWEKEKYITLEKNQDYWGEKAIVDTLNFKYGEKAVSKSEFIIGVGIPDDTNYEIKKLDKLVTAYVALNCVKEPFKDINARKAVAYTLNPQALHLSHFKKFGVLANTFLPQMLPGFNGDIKVYEQNLGMAKEWAGKANLKEKNLIAIDLLFGSKDLNKDITNNLKSIGLNVEFKGTIGQINPTEEIKKNSYDMMISGWQCDIPDPDNFALMLESSSKELNLSQYGNKEIDDLIIKARAMPNGEERNNIYKKIQIISHEDVAIIPLFQNQIQVSCLKKVKNFTGNPVYGILFSKISLD